MGPNAARVPLSFMKILPKKKKRKKKENRKQIGDKKTANPFSPKDVFGSRPKRFSGRPARHQAKWGTTSIGKGGREGELALFQGGRFQKAECAVLGPNRPSPFGGGAGGGGGGGYSVWWWYSFSLLTLPPSHPPTSPPRHRTEPTKQSIHSSWRSQVIIMTRGGVKRENQFVQPVH